jgi:nicotinamidase-related amidase
MPDFELSGIILLLIDNQIGLDHPTYYGTDRSNPSYYKNLPALLKRFRALRQEFGEDNISIIHVYHKSIFENSPLYGSPGMDFYPFAVPLPDEPVISKQVHSAFGGTTLEQMLRQRNVRTLFIAGAVTDHCISTSVRAASDLNVTKHMTSEGHVTQGCIILVEDATYCFGKSGIDALTVHKVNVASLKDEFCEIMTTAQVLIELSNGM